VSRQAEQDVAMGLRAMVERKLVADLRDLDRDPRLPVLGPYRLDLAAAAELHLAFGNPFTPPLGDEWPGNLVVYVAGLEQPPQALMDDDGLLYRDPWVVTR
jgi:hypothetical protein